MVLEKTLESPLDCKEIQPGPHKGDQSCVFIGRTDAEAQTPIFCPPDDKSWLIWKDPDGGKDWGKGEIGKNEEEMFWWHHQHNDMGLGVLWELVMDREDRKESDTTEQLNWTKNIIPINPISTMFCGIIIPIFR